MMDLWNGLVLFAGLVITPVLTVSYAPQIWKLFKTKNAEGISISFWLILDASLLCLFILAVDVFMNTGSISLIIAQGANLLLALIVTAQVLIYSKGK